MARKAKNNYQPADFMPLADWIKSGAGGVLFDTSDKVYWILRHHRRAVEASGEFIAGVGSRPHLVGPRFGAVLLEIVRKARRAHLCVLLALALVTAKAIAPHMHVHRHPFTVHVHAHASVEAAETKTADPSPDRPSGRH